MLYSSSFVSPRTGRAPRQRKEVSREKNARRGERMEKKSEATTEEIQRKRQEQDR